MFIKYLKVDGKTITTDQIEVTPDSDINILKINKKLNSSMQNTGFYTI